MKGQIVLITGAASGIGRAIAEQAAQEGASVLLLLDLDTEKLDRTADALNAPIVETHAVDIVDDEALKLIFEGIALRYGRLDTVYNSAGIQAGLPAWPDAPPAKIRSVIGVNLIGLIYVTQLAIPLMKEHGGSILNIASVSGLQPYLSGAIYGPSKAAVIHFTQCNEALASEFGIRMNALCPGMVNTPFLSKTGVNGEVAPWLKEKLEAGEVLSPADVARAAVRLAADTGKAGQYEVLATPPHPAIRPQA